MSVVDYDMVDNTQQTSMVSQFLVNMLCILSYQQYYSLVKIIYTLTYQSVLAYDGSRRDIYHMPLKNGKVLP